MKANAKTLIYDDDCPLCSAYTQAFVKTGMLHKEGRKSFREVDDVAFALVDKKRCHNEIPLIDKETRQIWYGIDALLEILGNKVPFLKFVGNIRPVKWALQITYKFISYNRKVIVAKKSRPGYDCSPDFNAQYRFAFLIFFFLFNSLMLFPLYYDVFSRSFIRSSSLFELQTAHLSFVMVNISCAMLLKKNTAFEFLGQVNMLALITVLLMVPLLLVNRLFPLAGWFNNSYLAVVTVFIARQYIHRMSYAGIIPNKYWLIVTNILSLIIFLTYLIM
jgi:predicted DCC family thiol-disulfide oxidoreductase YuxK